MNILDRYLYRTVLVYTVMAMAVLLTLGALFVFISQQGDIGVGNYSAGDAFLFTLLNVPQQAFELLPIGAMIGALMGLGNLASGSELVVTRASGVSVWRIAWPVGLAGLTLAGGVSLFQLDGPTRLRSIQRAERISVATPGRWSLHNVATTHFGDDRIDSDLTSGIMMQSNVNPAFLGLAATDPQLLTLRGLASYIDHLRRNNLDTASYEIGYWSRIARLFAVIVVTLLALPFVFGPLRTGAGTRTVIGVMLGVIFFLITGTIEKGGQIFGLNPALVGWLPTATIGLCTLIAISRTR
jgi:lipopolysaccharide export system permease protein